MKKERFVPLESSYDTASAIRLCDYKGCEHAGEFRAPKSPHLLHEYYWFCLDHVREYNKGWDFYRGMSAEEIEASRVSDVTWNRPSWPVGGWHTLLESARYFDGIDPFLKAAPRPSSLSRPVRQSLDILGLTLPLTLETLRKQYKKLAKRYHPDLNPHDKEAEDRLKRINEAYQVVKKYIEGF